MSVEKLMKLPIKHLALALSLALLTLLPATGAHAATLEEAKSQGMVCELPTGYLKPTGKATGDVKAMAQGINAKRKAEYERIAKENNVQPDQVGKLTAQKLGPRCP